MATVPMIAKRPLLYAGRRVASGAEFEARTGQDARLLIAIGRADFAPAGAPAEEVETLMAAVPAAFVEEPPQQVAAPTPAEDAPAVEVAAEQPAAEPAAEPAAQVPPPAPAEDVPAVKPRRTYRRRDLTAEGSE